MTDAAASRSAELFQRARRVIADGVSRTTIAMKPHPIYLQSASGARVCDVDGHELIDFNNNYTSLIHGHSRPEVVAALARQAPRGMAYSFGNESEIALAELICDRVSGIERIRFCNSGTEAVMNAIKAARAYTGRAKIAKCEGAYHGSYDYAEVSLDAGPQNWGDAAAPDAVAYASGTPPRVLADTVVIPYNDLPASLEILRRHAGDLAGILLDPVSSRVGMVGLEPEFLSGLEAYCQQTGTLLIFDEVIAYRLGYRGAQGDLGVQPDLTALGKIIGGGLPVGAIAGRADVMAVFEEVDGRRRLPHGGTFNANPMTMVAGHAAMELMDEAAFERLNKLGALARKELSAALTLANVEGQVTGEGSLFRLHLHSRKMKNYREARLSAAEQSAMAALNRAWIERGIFMSSYGLGCLSTATTETDVAKLAEATVAGLRSIREDMRHD